MTTCVYSFGVSHYEYQSEYAHDYSLGGDYMDIFIGAGIASVIMYAATKWDASDQHKLKHIFNNLN